MLIECDRSKFRAPAERNIECYLIVVHQLRRLRSVNCRFSHHKHNLTDQATEQGDQTSE